MATHPLLTDESIEAWIAEHDPNGVEKLMTEVRLERIRGARAQFVSHWFERRSATLNAEAATANDELQRRNVEAAERSAKAAEDSAASSKLSARISICSALVALAALAVSAWPYIEVVGRAAIP